MIYAEKKRDAYIVRKGASFQGQRDLPLNSPVKKIYDTIVNEIAPTIARMVRSGTGAERRTTPGG